MDERTGQVAAWIAGRLTAFPVVDRAVVFGSRARGGNRETSDVDIAVEAPGADPMQWADIVEAIDEAPTLLRLEILRMETAPEELRAKIERDGVVIYGAVALDAR